MILTTYVKGDDVYQTATYADGTVPPPKRGYTVIRTETRPSVMDTVRGRNNCTRQLRTMTRKQRDTMMVIGRR